jgi:hypothetical protein
VFDGSDFRSLGNQKVKNYFFSNLNQTYADRIFMVNNTQKNQVELYYPDLNSTGWCNKMLSWRYDLKLWNSPRDVANACMATEAPVYNGSSFNYASRTVTYARGSVSGSKMRQTNITNGFAGSAISCLFERTNAALQTAEGPVPYSAKVYIHRILPESVGTGKLTISVGGANSAAQTPTYGTSVQTDIVTDNPWVTTQQNTVEPLLSKWNRTIRPIHGMCLH